MFFVIMGKQKLAKLLTGIHMKGLTLGYRLGIRIGRMEAGDKGIIVSARVQQEIEEILKRKGG